MATGALTIDIGIPADQRAQIAEALGRVLADSTVLYAKTHGFHWNVTGPMFNTLHVMFMQQYTEIWTALDEIAERIRALGHPAPFGGDTYSRLSSIPESQGVPAALEMVGELVAGHEAVARTIRGVFPLAEAANDQPTADLLTQRLQIHEKTAWMLRSLLEG
jgi:starvation-inducible DNA-binding protein